jgi:hypothetical protein
VPCYAAICTHRMPNHSDFERFRPPEATLNLRVEGSIPSRLTRFSVEEEAFQAAYADARKAAFQVGISRVQTLMGRAVDTLEDLLGAKKHPKRSPEGGANRCRARNPSARCRSDYSQAKRNSP